ncbi:MAG: hypothetical protein BECKG1743D_GA0114223_105232 [Candidatus Kentron sp. G]|nr:MAG: hypothetical protein BECKG1743D_GA0114223_105232 [Candidatus Kentron sp. G]
MRLPRALNPNENPAQFGIFFSANRLSRVNSGRIFYLGEGKLQFGFSFSRLVASPQRT